MDTNRIKNYDPTGLVEKVRSAPIAWVILIILWLGWMLQPFYYVGMTTGDQLAFSMRSLDEIFTEAFNHAKYQGRIYFILTKVVDIWVNTHPTSAFITLFSFVVYLATPLSVAYVFFTGRLERILFLGIFLCVSWNGFDHQPPAAYPVVNHFIFPFWAYLAYRFRTNEARAEKLFSYVGFFLLSYLCLFQYEPVTVMSVVAIGWVLYSSPFSGKLKVRYASVFGAAILGYALTYMLWSRSHPADYPGIVPGEPNLLIVVKVIVAYTLGAIPLLRPIRDRLGWGDEASVVREIQHIPHFKAEFFGTSGFFLALGAILFIWLICRTLNSKTRPDFSSSRNKLIAFSVAAAAFTIGPNLLLGFSVKYQEWVQKWIENYLTSQLSMYGWCLIAVPIVAFLCRKIDYKSLPIGVIAISLFFNSIGFFVREQNKEVGMRQRSNIVRWEALDIVATMELDEPIDTLVAPQFYFFSHSYYPDLARYWKTYSNSHYDLDWTFARDLDKVDNPDARLGFVNYSVTPHGRLETLILKTEKATYVVAASHHRPAGIISHSHKDAMPLNWGKRHATKHAGLWVAKISSEEFPHFVGIENTIEVFSTLPSAHP